MENNVIGRVLATEKRPTTIDDFTFWTDPQLISSSIIIFSTFTTPSKGVCVLFLSRKRIYQTPNCTSPKNSRFSYLATGVL